MIRDSWEWDPEAPFHPLFEREAKRRDLLLGKRNRTPLEERELKDGYLPFAYVGATYFGQPVNVSRMMDGTNDRTPWLVNDPNQWIDLSPPFSVKGWPQGPPGWIKMTPGEDYPADLVVLTGMERFRRLGPPWDVTWSRQLRER